jgi:hypothetical protein
VIDSISDHIFVWYGCKVTRQRGWQPDTYIDVNENQKTPKLKKPGHHLLCDKSVVCICREYSTVSLEGQGVSIRVKNRPLWLETRNRLRSNNTVSENATAPTILVQQTSQCRLEISHKSKSLPSKNKRRTRLEKSGIVWVEVGLDSAKRVSRMRWDPAIGTNVPR